MPSPEQIDSFHRLHHLENWSLRKIARHLKLNRRTVAKFLSTPAVSPPSRPRPSRLDPFKAAISRVASTGPLRPTLPSLPNWLRPLGYQGGLTILKDYLRDVRARASKRAYVRVESLPGERFEIDWGHFGSLDYEGHQKESFMPSPPYA